MMNTIYNFRKNLHGTQLINSNSAGRGGVQTGSTQHVGNFWLIAPAPGDCEDIEFGGMKIVRGNRSTRRKPTPAPLCAPQVPLDETRAAAGNQRLTASAMARPYIARKDDEIVFDKRQLGY
jgi:hypothetical protein